MAYRRRPTGGGFSSSSSFPSPTSAIRNDPVLTPKPDEEDDVDRSNSNSNSFSPSRLATRAIRASSANRDSSLSSAYSSPLSPTNPTSSTTATAAATASAATSPSFPSPKRDPGTYQYTSMKNLNESKHGFWGNLARKAKAFLDDDVSNSPQNETPQGTPGPDSISGSKYYNEYGADENRRKPESPVIQKGLGAITSSLTYIGGTIGSAVEEGITKVENRTAGIIQETRKHIRKKPGSTASPDQGMRQPYKEAQVQPQAQVQHQAQTDLELQLKASRDVAMAMAAKAKLLLRELKTVKADFAFAKERCAQLEEENRILRQSRHRENGPEDDDLIRLQLETLLAEKARLAHENSVYARENRFLREVVEYHQLTMQDVVYLDEGSEEVTEVYPIKVVSVQTPTSPSPEGSLGANPQFTRDILPHPTPPPDVSINLPATNSSVPRTIT